MSTFIFADKNPYTATEAIVAWALVPEAAGFYVIQPHLVATPGPGMPIPPGPAPVTTNVASGPRPANYKTDADWIAASQRVVFHVPNLAPGTYTFDVQAPGGAVLTSNAVTLTAAAPAKASVESRLTALEVAVAALVAAVPQAHPADPVPTPAPAGKWHRSPGAAYVPGESAADNPTRAKELAAQFRDVAGTVFVSGSDCNAALADCDFLALDTTTAQQADSKIEGCLRTGTDSAIYQRMTGKTQGGGGLGGRLRLMYPERSLEDLIHAIGQPIGGNVSK